MYKYILIPIILLALQLTAASANSPDDGTMLMFVGEDIELLSIASKREETPAKAPAVVRVITRDEFRSRGQNTLSRILQSTPGFHMARKEWGHKPYLRGMPDSVMFLYDTVPIGSELSKSLHPIDHELSLAPVKQVEIIRGPSSVLWGPDAFAGVVNVVPLTGKDFQGVETGVFYGEPGTRKKAYLNFGKDFEAWDGFLSISLRNGDEDRQKANLVSFFDYDGSRPVPPDQRMRNNKPGDATYVDSYARVNIGNKVSLSGRYSYSFHPYILEQHEDGVRWVESRRLPSGYIKLDLNHDLNLQTRVRFSGYYSRMNPEYEIIDLKNRQTDESFYAEALVDRSMFKGNGLLTTGLSYRNKSIENAPIWDNYYPGFLVRDNETYLPQQSTRNFDNEMLSPFVQYSHKLGNFDFMFGLRQDFHQEYRNSLSYNSALVWAPSTRWSMKVLYGTAYRTPFARQFLNKDQPDMEKSENFTFQASWTPGDNFSLTKTLFYNRLSSHRNENLLAASQAKASSDEYYGLSDPNSQDIYGLEIEALYSPVPNIDLKAGLTLLDNTGPDEKYRYVMYSIESSGNIIDVYGQMEMPFDTGPKTMFNLSADWKFSNRLSFFAEAKYFSSMAKIFAEDEVPKSSSGQWMVNAGAVFRDFMTRDMDLYLNLRNITDNRYLTPGTYSMMRDRGISGDVGLRYRF